MCCFQLPLASPQLASQAISPHISGFASSESFVSIPISLCQQTVKSLAEMAPRLDRSKWVAKTQAKTLFCLKDSEVRSKECRRASGLLEGL